MMPTKPHPEVRRLASKNKKYEDGADDQAIERQVRTFERQGLVTDRDVTAQND
jgi:hypothetical protein